MRGLDAVGSQSCRRWLSLGLFYLQDLVCEDLREILFLVRHISYIVGQYNIFLYGLDKDCDHDQIKLTLNNRNLCTEEEK